MAKLQIRKSQLTFKVLTIVASPTTGVNKDEDSELLRLVGYHESLLREPSTSEMSWAIIDKPRGERYFDLRADPLLEVAKRVRELIHDSNSTQLVSQPQWFQLAVLAAAKAGIFQEDKATRITQSKAVMDRVSRAYDNTDILRTMYDVPLPLQENIASNRTTFNSDNI